MKKLFLIETEEAQIALQELYETDPVKLRSFLADSSNDVLKNYLEGAARRAINIRNKMLDDGQPSSVANEFAVKELQATNISESEYTKKDLAKLAIFKVTQMKVKQGEYDD